MCSAKKLNKCTLFVVKPTFCMTDFATRPAALKKKTKNTETGISKKQVLCVHHGNASADHRCGLHVRITLSNQLQHMLIVFQSGIINSTWRVLLDTSNHRQCKGDLDVCRISRQSRDRSTVLYTAALMCVFGISVTVSVTEWTISWHRGG